MLKKHQQEYKIKEGVEHTIISEEFENGYKHTLTLHDNYRLSDVFEELPYGIIDKQITGIGATHLELNSPRNSIIVEPLKSIASGKASQNKDFLYVGSSLTFKNKSTSLKEIEEYLERDIEYKKIIVVADSISKVIDSIGEENIKDFFFMIDEIDSFQADSTFRESMELCFDYYQLFPIENRCLISATIIEFSNPILQYESFLKIEVDNEIKRNINLIHTNDVIQSSYHKIIELLKVDPSSKILVAYSSIQESLKIINLLVQGNNVSKDDIAFMCSNSSYKDVGEYYSIIKNDKLPKKLNFLTSAYFTGIDINEKYHAITVSNGDMRHTILSNLKMKQIAGRCRKKLLSENIIYSSSLKTRVFLDAITKEDLMMLATSQIRAFECFDYQYRSNPLLKEQLVDLRKSITQFQNYRGYNLYRTDLSGKPKVSFFNIDAFLESQRVRNDLYSDKNALNEILKQEGHKINFEECNYVPLIDNDFKNPEFQLEAKQEALDNLEKLDFEEIINLRQHCGSNLQANIYTQYLDLWEYFDKSYLIDKIKEFSESRDSRNFTYFKISTLFFANDEYNFIKTDILSQFKIGKRYSSSEIFSKLKFIFDKNFIPAGFDYLNSQKSAVLFFKLIFDTARRSQRKPSIEFHEILGFNPIMDLIKKDSEVQPKRTKIGYVEKVVEKNPRLK